MQIHVICLRFSVGVLRHQSKQQLVASSFPNQRPIFSRLFYYSVFADNFVRFAKYRNRQISQIQPQQIKGPLGKQRRCIQQLVTKRTHLKFQGWPSLNFCFSDVFLSFSSFSFILIQVWVLAVRLHLRVLPLLRSKVNFGGRSYLFLTEEFVSLSSKSRLLSFL